MEFALEKAAHRRAVLAVALVLALILVYQGGWLWVADTLVASENTKTIARGVSLEPGDGDAWDRLGRYDQWDFANPDPDKAASEYLHAVHDDPNSAHFWMDLAGAYEAEGNTARANEAWMKARSVYPASAEVEWNYGNYLLRQQDTAGGYAMIHQAVMTDPTLLPLAISRTWRSTQDIQALMNDVLPATPEAYLKALDFFASTHDVDSGMKIWRKLIEMKKPIPIAATFAFFQALIDQDRSSEASEVWREAIAAAGITAHENGDGSLAWNGDFASDFLNGGLDWRWFNQPGASIDFDAAPPGEPGRSIKLDFIGGMNPDLIQPYEYIPVEPGNTYHFHGYIRTQDISTESGIRFSLTDPNHDGAPGLATDAMTESHPWTAVESDLTTGPETHFLVLRIRRTPSRLFENKLSGSVWVADISLRVSTATEPAKP